MKLVFVAFSTDKVMVDVVKHGKAGSVPLVLQAGPLEILGHFRGTRCALVSSHNETICSSLDGLKFVDGFLSVRILSGAGML